MNEVNYSYDNLGRLDLKGFQSGNSIKYAYNLRGELTGLSHSAYRQTLYFETGATPCYYGNISAMKQAFGSTPDITRTYTYDTLNRLTACTSTDGFNTAYAYDLNSSPLTIEPYGLPKASNPGTTSNRYKYSATRSVSEPFERRRE